MRSRTTSELLGRGESARVFYAIRKPWSITLSLCRLVAALCLTLGLFAVELAGFLSGVSMFNSTQSLLCILSAWPASPCDIITTHSFHFCRPFGHKSLPYVAKRISLGERF